MVLEGLDDLLIEHSLKFKFKASNNQTEYETVIIGMSLTLEVGTFPLKAKKDSKLVEKKVVSEYQMMEPQLIKYLKKVCAL